VALTWDGKYQQPPNQQHIQIHMESPGVTGYFNNEQLDYRAALKQHPEARFNLSGGSIADGLDCCEPVVHFGVRRSASADARKAQPWASELTGLPLPDESHFPGTSQTGNKNISGGKLEEGLTRRPSEECVRDALQTKQKGRSSSTARAAHSLGPVPWGSESDVPEVRARSVEATRAMEAISSGLPGIWDKGSEAQFETEMGRKNRQSSLSPHSNPIKHDEEGNSMLESTMGRKNRLTSGMLMSSPSGAEKREREPSETRMGLRCRQQSPSSARSAISDLAQNMVAFAEQRASWGEVANNVQPFSLSQPREVPCPRSMRGRSPMRQSLRHADSLMAVAEEPDFDPDEQPKISLRSLHSTKTPTKVAKKSTAPKSAHLYEFIAASPFPVFCPTPVPGIWVAPWGESPPAGEAAFPADWVESATASQSMPEGGDATGARPAEKNMGKRRKSNGCCMAGRRGRQDTQKDEDDRDEDVMEDLDEDEEAEPRPRRSSTDDTRRTAPDVVVAADGSPSEENDSAADATRGPAVDSPQDLGMMAPQALSLRSRNFRATTKQVDFKVERLPTVPSIYGGSPLARTRGTCTNGSLEAMLENLSPRVECRTGSRRGSTYSSTTACTPQMSPGTPDNLGLDERPDCGEDEDSESRDEDMAKTAGKEKPGDLKITCRLNVGEKNKFVWALKSSTEANSMDIDFRKARLPSDTCDTPPIPSTALPHRGLDSLMSVASENGVWNWVLLGVDPDELPIVGGGDGSIEEMKQCLACCTRDALFGLLRLSFGSGCFRQTKFVSLQVRLRGESEGLNVFPILYSKLSQFATISATMEIASADELTPEAVINSILAHDSTAEKSVVSPSGFWAAFAEERAVAKERRQMMTLQEDETSTNSPCTPWNAPSAVSALTPGTVTPDTSVPPSPCCLNSSRSRSEICTADEEEAVHPEMAARNNSSLLLTQPGVCNVKIVPPSWPRSFAEKEPMEEPMEEPSPTSLASSALHAHNLHPADSPPKKPDTPTVRRSMPPMAPGSVPIPLSGVLLQTDDGGSDMHPRYLEVLGGRLRFWLSKVDREAGEQPRYDINLTRLTVERKLGHSGKFKMRVGLGTSAQSFSVNADVPLGSSNSQLAASTHPREEWITALRQHSAYASSTRRGKGPSSLQYTRK